MTDPDLQDFADLWTQADAAEQEAFERMARKARLRGRIFAYLDFAAVAFIIGITVFGFVARPGTVTMIAAIGLIVTTLIVTRKRRQIRQMARALDTASRQAFIETSISNASANLRRNRLGLAFFPLGVVLALTYKMAVRTGGRSELMLGSFVEWIQTARGIISLILLALVFAWGLRSARRAKLELQRMQELRSVYAEADRNDEDGSA
jgi:hypothetical protein